MNNRFCIKEHSPSLTTVYVIALIYASGSIWLRYNVEGRYLILICALISLPMIFLVPKLRFDIGKLIFIAVCETCIVLSVLINGINITFDVYTMLVLILAFGISLFFDFHGFASAFTNGMCILALLSLINFGANLLFTDALSFFPTFEYGNWTLRNCFIGVYSISGSFKRNFGIFSEPGMYAVYLSIALYFELFHGKRRIWTTSVLILTILSTLSTLGIIAVPILTIIACISKKASGAFRIRCLSLVAGMFIILAIIFAFDHDLFLFTFDKLRQIGLSGDGSGAERWRALTYSFELFTQNPIFGAGRVGFQAKFNSIIATFTPMNWFAMYGLIFGFFCNLFWVRSAFYSYGTNRICAIILAILLILIISTQNMSSDQLIWVIILLSSDKKSLINAKQH